MAQKVTFIPEQSCNLTVAGLTICITKKNYYERSKYFRIL